MTSVLELPLDKIYSFLAFRDRVSLGCCSKSVYTLVSKSLSLGYDLEISYQSFRSTLTRPKKKKFSLPVISQSNTKYLMLEDQVFRIPDVIKSLPYEFESSLDGYSTFYNKFQDRIVLHSSLIETCIQTEDTYKCLIDADDLNDQIDFTNPAALLKRQKLLLEKINKSKAENEEHNKKEVMKHVRNWGDVVIILCHGGNFNIAGFTSQGKCIETHSDHKYVTRKKQGGRQSVADKQSGTIHSKGASIRRENERKHAENIETMIEESKNVLDRASLIFLHAPGNNYYVFIGDKGYLEKWKHKVRPVGITTNKAKFQETERVFKEISTVRVLFKCD